MLHEGQRTRLVLMGTVEHTVPHESIYAVEESGATASASSFMVSNSE